MLFKLLVIMIKSVYKVALKGKRSSLKNLADLFIHSLIKIILQRRHWKLKSFQYNKTFNSFQASWCYQYFLSSSFKQNTILKHWSNCGIKMALSSEIHSGVESPRVGSNSLCVFQKQLASYPVKACHSVASQASPVVSTVLTWSCQQLKPINRKIDQ